MIEIAISFEQEEQEEISSLAHATLQAAFKILALNQGELSLSFVSNEYMQVLNHDYRGLDEVTDVLSFGQEATDEWPTTTDDLYQLGDIVVALEYVRSNSVELQVPFEEELQRVLIHSLLHLTGMDHASNDEDEPMLRLQEKLLQQIRKGGTV